MPAAAVASAMPVRLPGVFVNIALRPFGNRVLTNYSHSNSPDLWLGMIASSPQKKGNSCYYNSDSPISNRFQDLTPALPKKRSAQGRFTATRLAPVSLAVMEVLAAPASAKNCRGRGAGTQRRLSTQSGHCRRLFI